MSIELIVQIEAGLPPPAPVSSQICIIIRNFLMTKFIVRTQQSTHFGRGDFRRRAPLERHASHSHEVRGFVRGGAQHAHGDVSVGGHGLPGIQGAGSASKVPHLLVFHCRE